MAIRVMKQMTQMNNIIIDTGFWRAIFNPSDKYSQIAERIEEKYFNKPAYKILIPFPTMYELLRTEFVKNKTVLDRLDDYVWHNSFVVRVSDEKYRDIAHDEMIGQRDRNFSFVDSIIRVMIDDVSLKINGIVTFNERDFVDICRNKQVELIDY